MGDPIDALIEDATVDAYGPDEQRWAFRRAFEDTVPFPITGQIVGVDAGHDGGLRRRRPAWPGRRLSTRRPGHTGHSST